MQPLDDFILQAGPLPPAPRSVPRVLALLQDPTTDSRDLVTLLKFDPALTAGLLRVCNSAMYAGSQKVDSLEEAILRLGFREVYRLVARLCCEETLARPQAAYGLDQGELWRHAVATAVACSVVAERTGTDPNTSFTAGLLHDLGKIVLNGALARQYAQVVAAIERQQQSFWEAEKAVLGFHHAEVGGRLLERWEFSERLVQAVWHHHAPAAAGAHQALAAQVHLANMLAHFLGQGFGHHAFALRGQAETLGILGLPPAAVEELLAATTERLEAETKTLTAGTD